jgi:hypothetical protein
MILKSMTDHTHYLKCWNKYPEEVHAYTGEIAPNFVDKDELTLAQAQKPDLWFEWPLRLETIRIERTYSIVTNDVIEPIKIDDVPIEKQNKIFIVFF